MKATPPSQPKYRIVADRLRQQIYDGTFKPGDRLPSFKEMRQQLGVTQPTMERAHSQLEQEGLIRREQGRGTFVLEPADAGTGDAPARPTLMDHTVALLTLDEGGAHEHGHDMGGWREFITAGVMEQARADGLNILTMHPNRITRSGLNDVLSARPLGVVITDLEDYSAGVGAVLGALKHARIPAVLYGDMPEIAEFDRVTSDQEQGSYDLTQWMIRGGRRRIRNIWESPANQYWFAERYRGYARAMAEHGLEPRETLLVERPDRLDAAGGDDIDMPTRFARSMRHYVGYLAEDLLGPEPSDALLCSSDGESFCIAAACEVLRKEPDRDISIAGYDNYWFESENRRATRHTPAATVDKRNRLIGTALIALLQERIAGTLPPEPVCRKIVPTLIATDRSEPVASDRIERRQS